MLIERTEGNPLFLEESVRTLVELGALAGHRGAFRLVKSLDAISIPATVQSILAARIDRLSVEDKRLLQTASVVGKDVPFTLIHAIAELDEDGLRLALGRLQAAEFLYEVRLFPDLEYTFKHALTHEVAYASLLQEPRRTLHARIIDVIEHLYAGRLAEHVERLAYHAVRGAAWDKAVTYCGDAGDRVYERSAAVTALGYYEQALDAVRQLPENRRTIERTIDLCMAIRTPLAQLVEYERVFNYLRDAERLALAVGDDARLGQIFALLTFSKYQARDPRGAIESGERALKIAGKGRDRDTENTAGFFMAQAYLLLGEYDRALFFYERAATAAAAAEKEPGKRMRLPTRQGVVRGWWAICLAEVGRFPEAFLRGEEAIEVANRVGEPFSRVAAYFCLGEVQVQQGNVRQAMPLLSRAFDMCREFNVRMYHQRILGALGHAQVLLGDLVDGLTALEEAVAWGRSKNIEFRGALLLASYSEALLMSGRRDEALTVAREAIEAARSREDVPNEARALRIHAEVISRDPAPDFAIAQASYRDALRLAELRGMRPLVAHCHLGLGKLYRRTGQREQAQEHLTTATTMYREMGMTYWLEQAEAELGQLA
jgi:tetratricopeptide (TPR) repeat protein